LPLRQGMREEPQIYWRINYFLNGENLVFFENSLPCNKGISHRIKIFDNLTISH